MYFTLPVKLSTQSLKTSSKMTILAFISFPGNIPLLNRLCVEFASLVLYEFCSRT